MSTQGQLSSPNYIALKSMFPQKEISTQLLCLGSSAFDSNAKILCPSDMFSGWELLERLVIYIIGLVWGPIAQGSRPRSPPRVEPSVDSAVGAVVARYGSLCRQYEYSRWALG